MAECPSELPPLATNTLVTSLLAASIEDDDTAAESGLSGFGREGLFGGCKILVQSHSLVSMSIGSKFVC